MIEVQSLTKRYGPATAVEDLSFTVESGIVTGFLGPNGAGKSTTMRMITGLDEPTSGSATIDGKFYRDLDKPLTRVGTLLDAKWVHPNRSAANHLKWLAAANGIPRKRVGEVLDLVGLSDVAGRKAGKFSLGMGQRLGLAAALLGDPDTLILDEPVNGLDPEGIRWVRDFVRSLAAEGRTVLISSHLLSEMSLTADRLVVIGRGRLVADTTTHDFIRNSSESSTVVRSEHLDELQKALGDEGIEVERSTDEDEREILVAHGTSPDDIGRIAFSYGLMLLELSERRASLEDAFMQMTGHAVDYQTGGHPDEGQDAGTVAQRLPGISGLPGIDGTDNLGGTN
ncbi:ABC transporter ATP-binding protein [Corynebacterium variabile]|uniref:ABC transporter ATP-binding protein n=1 Tax=Corynebacterium variabile TaxID=1727 RepID=UPI001DACE5B5|nr:ABC transporter ATP-binding protein [Corynebacterium variabile]HJG45770.1 ABC transporter ATP-binding protein [Corynebacterium variabile]